MTAGQARDHERPFELYISYAAERRHVVENLLIHLEPYRRTGLIQAWTDHDIKKGAPWRPELELAMDRCDAALPGACPRID